MISIYIPDVHSPDADAHVTSQPGCFLTALHRSEFAHAVEQNVFRRRISASAAKEIYGEFARDCRAGIWVEADFPNKAFETCIALAHRHAARLGTRTLDTLHVACALELKAERFWTFDERQRKLARAAGLKTS